MNVSLAVIPSLETRSNRRLAYHLHEFILALWGMPLGEMLDLEKLAQRCKELGKYTFFFSSTPANCPGKYIQLFAPNFEYANTECCAGGVSSHVNGQAIL